MWRVKNHTLLLLFHKEAQFKEKVAKYNANQVDNITLSQLEKKMQVMCVKVMGFPICFVLLFLQTNVRKTTTIK